MLRHEERMINGLGIGIMPAVAGVGLPELLHGSLGLCLQVIGQDELPVLIPCDMLCRFIHIEDECLINSQHLGIAVGSGSIGIVPVAERRCVVEQEKVERFDRQNPCKHPADHLPVDAADETAMRLQ